MHLVVVGVPLCNTPTEMLCFEGTSSSFTLHQQPEIRKILLTHKMTLVEGATHHKCVSRTLMIKYGIVGKIGPGLV